MDDLAQLCGKRILITGATGLIGQNLIKKLLAWNQKTEVPIKIIAVVRDREKAEKLFGFCNQAYLKYLVSDICELKPQSLGVDFIVHAASQTSSKDFIAKPVETIFTALNGLKNILELARVNQILGMVYLSSMEVYGTPVTNEKIDERHSSNLDTMAVRSCYPESKRMCENLCVSYISEYGLPVMVVRLTQTFGPGVQYHDERVFAEFARCVIERKNIVLNTRGETRRNYLYTEDAVNAILTVLLKGQPGEAYNAANEETYCSIYEMACFVAKNCSKGEIQVIIHEQEDITKMGYAPALNMNLDTTKLKTLGWKADTGLKTMYDSMIEDMRRKVK